MNNVAFLNEMEPFYFGVSQKKLYGCHHIPQNVHSRACAIVLCYPIGHEYINSHRSIYQLAVRLSRTGFHVLRFDYFGCGDSNGEFEQGTLLQWTNDIHTAIEEIRDRSGLTSVCLIGLRIGANLALKALDDCRHIDSIILWEPILDGKLYLRELAESQKQFIDRMGGSKGRPSYGPEMPSEILGYSMSSELKQDLELINMDNVRLRSNVKFLTLWNAKDSNSVNAPYPFLQKHPHADIKLIPDHEVWMQELFKRLIPFNTLNYLKNWVETVYL